MIPRRRLLKLAVASPLVISAATQVACGFIQRGSEDISFTQFGTLLTFNHEQANTLFAFSEACLALEPGEIIDTNVIARLDEEFYFVSSFIRSDFKLALNVMEYLPIVYGSFSRFSKLSTIQREDLLDKFSHTKSDTVRAVIHNLRMAVMLTFYGHESSWSAIKYDGSFSNIPAQQSTQRKHYQERTTAATQAHQHEGRKV